MSHDQQSANDGDDVFKHGDGKVFAANRGYETSPDFGSAERSNDGSDSAGDQTAC